MTKILQINFKFNVSAEEYRQAADDLAQAFSQVPGLVWKVWLLDEVRSEAGGIYFFDSEVALQQFLGSELAAQVTSHPALEDFSVKPFDVLAAPTAVTRGPVEVAAKA